MLIYFTAHTIEIKGEKCNISFPIQDKDFILHFQSGNKMKFRKNGKRDFSLVDFDFGELKTVISAEDYGRLCIELDKELDSVWLE